ncbi:MAG TPA: hypothetical protein VJ623_10785 [Holophagaceae bacterium]|nr:hypothetical protein [Holophagaceae bacterium]
MSLPEVLGRQHPALVHLPIAAAFLLPFPLALRLRGGEGWDRTIRYLSWAGVLGGIVAQATGLWFARAGELIPPQGWYPTSAGLLRTHQTLAMAGFGVGLATLAAVLRAATRGGRVWTLVLALGWAGLWGLAGHWGGVMVFPEAPDPALESEVHPSGPGRAPGRGAGWKDGGPGPEFAVMGTAISGTKGFPAPQSPDG